jgi:imidazole glycerol phosphate synthase glutamine amidotransferase subunit
MITIIDYGAGNLRSVENTLAELGAQYKLVRSASEVSAAAKLLLPGVGHLGQMMTALDQMGIRDALAERVKSGVPFLGICLGLQAMFESGAEAPEQRGLGFFPGHVDRFPLHARVPHMGWNEIVPRKDSRVLADIGPRPYLYFAHSYFCPVGGYTAATCEYETPFTAVLENGNVFGVQFHPEKSGPLGLKIVRNFVEIQ